jgi:hypothetical protein
LLRNIKKILNNLSDNFKDWINNYKIKIIVLKINKFRLKDWVGWKVVSVYGSNKKIYYYKDIVRYKLN